MKLPLKLSRSISNSPLIQRHYPPSSIPSSPGSTSSTSPTSSQKKLRFPKAPLGSSSHGNRRRHDTAIEIVEAPTSSKTPTSQTSAGSKGKSLVSGGSSAASSPSGATPWSQLSGKGKLTERGMQEIEQVFAQFDANGDGKISSEELQVVLASLGDETTREEAAMMVREVDTDGDGFIDLQEFVELNTRCLQSAAEEEMAAAFAIFDLDKNGRITAEELQQVLGRLSGSTAQQSSVEDCRRMIRGVDLKGVGHVDFDDFKRMMTPLTSSRVCS